MPWIKRTCALMLLSLVLLFSHFVYAEQTEIEDTIDRIQLVTQQINLLKIRLNQGEHELAELQQAHDKQISQLTVEKANKNLLDKASLDIAVSKSNLDSINVELADSQQTTNWLDKNIQEIENQLNVLGIFGIKTTTDELNNINELKADLSYQHKLLALEKSRVKHLQKLQTLATNILQLRNDRYNRINALLKSRKMLFLRQQQVKDELIFQEQQNQWLQQLNILYSQLAKIDPEQSREAYSSLERQIFYTNEKANLAYTQSLIARYRDQIQQMKFAVIKSSSISLLNEVGDEAQALSKQINHLDSVLKLRINALDKHVTYLSQRKKSIEEIQIYLEQLRGIKSQYGDADSALVNLDKSLIGFRATLEQALQNELSARQGFPTVSFKTLLDLGKETLLVPALTFQMIKSLSTHLRQGVYATTLWGWLLLSLLQVMLATTMVVLSRSINRILSKPSDWHEHLNSKWLSLQWLKRNLFDVVILSNIIGLLFFFQVPTQTFTFIIYFALVWLIFKSILTVARLCLMETMHHISGHDVKLYQSIKWIVLLGGTIVALTVFVHQLPLIYELINLCNWLFLLFLLVVSLLMLRSSEVLQHLILPQLEMRHPYLRRSIRFMSILVPLLMLGNSLIGLAGYMNLVLTISWYEGIFLIVLIGYLILRGLLSDGMEQLSRLMILYVNNGWLWTEAVLKPLDKVLKIALFLIAWATLFLFYGWDKQSPIVERLTRLLHYQLAHILNTTITPINIIELFVVISVFYWTVKWTREFVYRILSSRSQDMGIRNSIAILSQYSIVVLGAFISLRVLGIDLQALAFVASMFAFGIGLGLRDLANNFACGFLILLERPLRVGDIVNVNGTEGEVTHIGGRAITIKTWDHMDLVVPNAEIFNKTFTNWTARDNIVRSVVPIKISRYDNPHEVKLIIQKVLAEHKDVLKDPAFEVYLKEMNDTFMEFEVRYFVNIRQVKSRINVVSSVLMNIWDVFGKHGIKPPYPQQEIFLRNETSLPMLEAPTKNELLTQINN